MTATVALKRTAPSPSTVLVGAAVSSSREWLPMAELSNWVRGQGAQLVPSMVVDRTVASGGTGTLRFQAYTGGQAIERVWCLLLRAGTAAGATGTVKCGAGTTDAIRVNFGRDIRAPYVYREILTAKSAALTELTCVIVSTTGDIEIDSLSCTELARPSLNIDATDYGIDPQTLRPRERVFDSTSGVSCTGLYENTPLLDARRVGIYQWAVPTQQPITTTAAYADILTLGVPVLGRRLLSTGTTSTVYWSAYAKVSSGSGDVKLSTSSSAVADSVNVTATSFAWTTARAIAINCEAMVSSDGDGLASSGVFDELMPSFRANGGVTMSLAAISVWEQP